MKRPSAKRAARGPLLAAVVSAGAVALLCATPAAAQFGNIFGGNNPPRPPEDVPIQQRNPDFPPLEPPPTVRTAPQQQSRGAPVQAQPLPPPPGAPAVRLDARPQQSAAPSATPGLPPGQRQPRGTPQGQPGSQTASTPPAEEQPEPPTPKVANSIAVFSGLDKITGRIIAFDVAVNETVQFGALQVTPRACYTRPPTELPLTDGFVEVSEVTLQGEVRRIFTGWMFAASPGLHGVEHSIYDVWLTDCKNPQTKVAEDPPPAPAAPQPQQQRAQRPAGQPAARAPRPQQPAQPR